MTAARDRIAAITERADQTTFQGCECSHCALMGTDVPALLALATDVHAIAETWQQEPELRAAGTRLLAMLERHLGGAS